MCVGEPFCALPNAVIIIFNALTYESKDRLCSFAFSSSSPLRMQPAAPPSSFGFGFSVPLVEGATGTSVSLSSKPGAAGISEKPPVEGFVLS